MVVRLVVVEEFQTTHYHLLTLTLPVWPKCRKNHVQHIQFHWFVLYIKFSKYENILVYSKEIIVLPKMASLHNNWNWIWKRFCACSGENSLEILWQGLQIQRCPRSAFYYTVIGAVASRRGKRPASVIYFISSRGWLNLKRRIPVEDTLSRLLIGKYKKCLLLRAIEEADVPTTLLYIYISI